MDLIRQALGEDVLNYWGFSYGSFLGTVYSQMFPDRVGRFVIDGVMDATTYINSFAEFTLNNLIDTDDIFKGFVQECESAGPTRCALASTAMQSKSSVEKVFRKLLKDLKKDALVVVDGVSFPTVISADTVLAWLFRAYYAPSSWQVIAEAFAGLVEGDASQLVKLMNQSPDAAPTCPLLDESGSVGFVSVVCVDTVGNDMSIDKWKKYAAKNKEISEWFGESWTMQALTCKYWPAEASERYTGPWNKKLKNKVLIIGNRYDPVTPLRSAQIVEKVMEGNGVLLTREGYGHCSTSMVSFCALKHIREYFVNGTLPNKGTVCDTDFDVFPDKMVEAMMDSDTLKVVQDVKLVQELIIKSQPKF
ncbi:TAP-like protein-domain-containing protein [Obelidium mucronatum]|nr:TAP-like protein-domain-containing protein [Obelidium mucronatum]